MKSFFSNFSFLLCLVFMSPVIAQPVVPHQIAMQHFAKFKNGNKAVGNNILKEKHFLKIDANKKDNLLRQFSATYHSFAGLVDDAEEIFPIGKNYKANTFEKYQAVDAQHEIETLIGQYNIVMINEAHHIPKHRELVRRLLPAFKAQGFEYIAVEALSNNGEKNLNNNSLVSYQDGSYVVESSFAEFLHIAKTKEMKLISYDGSGKNRELESANNIINKVFSSNPNAKLFIFCGYAHINEQTMLASLLKKKLKQDILTISQTGIHTISNLNLNQNKPVVFKGKKNYWSSNTDHHDLNVYWPPAQYKNSRPNWFMKNRITTPLKPDWCELNMNCFIEVNYKNEPDAIPYDRILWKDITKPTDIRYIPNDTFLKTYTSDGKLIKSVELGDKIL